MSDVKVVALLTCHNRREMTLKSLGALFESGGQCAVDVSAIVVDAGSSDGTAPAVRAKFPSARVLEASAELFWSGGMRRAMQAGMETDATHFLWLNDDTYLYPRAIAALLEVSAAVPGGQPDAIVVGQVVDPQTGALTYGAVKMDKRWDRLSFRLTPVDDIGAGGDTMNGNCVLIPRPVVERIGCIDAVFTHGMGDYDYGLRARRAGFVILATPEPVAECSHNAPEDLCFHPGMTFGKRWRRMHSPKGVPPLEYFHLMWRHGGFRAFPAVAKLYIRLVFPWLWPSRRPVWRPR